MLIKNGFIINPASGESYVSDIRINDGVIEEISENICPTDDENIVDARGLTIAPGLIDTHVHFRDPGFTYKETLHTGSLAAAKGGFTSVICMANTSPVVDNTDVLEDILSRSRSESIRIYQAASVSRSLKGEEMTDMTGLKMRLSYTKRWRLQKLWMFRSACTKKIPHSLRITGSIMELSQNNSEYMVLLQSQRNPS